VLLSTSKYSGIDTRLSAFIAYYYVGKIVTIVDDLVARLRAA
jgi:hypothetical protein